MTAVESHAVIPGWNDDGRPLPERLDHELLVRAYRFSETAHLGQKRLSGENFVSHCVEVAEILAELQLDTTSHLRLDGRSYLKFNTLKDEGIAVSVPQGSMTTRAPRSVASIARDSCSRPTATPRSGRRPVRRAYGDD